ncbi:MAG: radical SAM protein [Clostridiales Family XIII bacterium]|jgi:radical SAM superfamily enzyme YgiQ (UPF0313 family)|nr:radical SAM protein [Clostridiales Family XIII bacterium]
MRSNNELTPDTIEALLKEYETPDHVVRHCNRVAQVAVNIAKAINAARFKDTDADAIPTDVEVTGIADDFEVTDNAGTTLLDVDLIYKAARLHDIVRTRENHAAEGAKIIEPYDRQVTEIIRAHMSHDLSADLKQITPTDIVSLADRMVKEDKYIGFEERMEDILHRFKRDAHALEVIKSRIDQTRFLIEQIEQLTGKHIDSIALGGTVGLDDILMKVERPGRYIGGEMNSIIKDPSDVDVRFCFAFPDLYEVGMSFTGLQIIYGMMNADNRIYCERAFAPQIDMEQIMREKGIPLFTLETHTDVREMDIIGFTLQFELSYTNILLMLELAHIPFLTKDRDLDLPLDDVKSTPIIVAGGPNAYNPETIADMIDVYMIGDGEELNEYFCHRYADAKKFGKTKREFLLEIALDTQMDGMYVPSLYEPQYEKKTIAVRTPVITDGSDIVDISYIDTEVEEFIGFKKLDERIPDRVKAHRIHDLDQAFFPEAPIVPFIDTIHDRAICEIMRGCPRGCRFCQAGYMYRPVRKRSPERINEIIDAQLANTGYDEVSLLSLSTGDYPGIQSLILNLMDKLEGLDVSLSLPSMRLDTFDEEALKRISEYRKSGLTFAPEAGSQRLRDVIFKNITEEVILKTIERTIDLGWNKVKCYFMIGLPGETYADLDAIVTLARTIMKRARQLQEKGKRTFNLTVSVSNFVPKPNTPFQWCAGNSEEELIKKNYYLKDAFKSVKGVNFQFHDTRTSYAEMMLAKGDRRALKAIINAYEHGAKFDSWREHFKYDTWVNAWADEGLGYSKDIYVNPDGVLPWSIIDTGVDPSLLRKQYDLAMELAETTEITETTDDARFEHSEDMTTDMGNAQTTGFCAEGGE